MNTNKLSKSIRTFIRREKAQIRRDVADLKEQEELISELYLKVHRQVIVKSAAPQEILKN